MKIKSFIPFCFLFIGTLALPQLSLAEEKIEVIPIIQSSKGLSGKNFNYLEGKPELRLLKVKIAPHKINTHLFQVNSFFIKNGNKVAEGKIIHCSLDVDSRNKIELPDQLERWIEASNVSTNLKEC